ncbi:MAG TPA: Kdo hydroxylase family protein [Casimicrobiaceae bacterium]|nr:Kdo hydroxylase family protein [Casimicrobiaceae bacterium]
MSAVVTLDFEGWLPTLTDEARDRVSRALEEGGVIRLPRVSFPLTDSERRFLSPGWSDGRAKNISLEGGSLRGAAGSGADRAELAAMVARFAAAAAGLVTALFPRYAPYVKRARSSYRPQGAVGRDVSWRKDDSRLHIDAFPSRPNHGERILRVFTNVNPSEDRVWRVGEPFETMAKTLLPRISAPLPGSSTLLAALHVTKGRRSDYDHLMLNLHDRAKADLAYQRDCAQETVHFAPGTTWICFSDQVMHAAVSGQFMLEQTIHLPVSALYDPSRSPLAILERLTGRSLVAVD